MLTERAKLAQRVIPMMEMGTGEPGSLSGPPPPLLQVSPSARAQERFSVTGNAIVTGGSGDLGLAACYALLEHGLQGLVIWDLNVFDVEPRYAALKSHFPGAKVRYRKVDVTDAEQVAKGVDEAVEMFGSVDILACFAGVVSAVSAFDTAPEQFRQVIDVNTTGAFLCAQAAAGAMQRQGTPGSIILTASISAHRINFPQPQVAYNLSKAAILSMKSSLAAEWGRYGIRVNSISPGYMDTILNEGAGLDEHKRAWYARNPMGRMGQPDELSGVVVLLASRAGSYINGADIIVDGGLTVF